MDAASTLQIPRAVVSAADEQDSETTMVVPAVRPGPPGPAGPPRQEELPAIAQEALTDVVAMPHHGPRSRQRRLEQHQNMLAAQAARQAEHEEVDGLVPTVKQPPPSNGTLSQRLDG
jgi:predicted neutral ceramidase superfamily lipid hydrolase